MQTLPLTPRRFQQISVPPPNTLSFASGRLLTLADPIFSYAVFALTRRDLSVEFPPSGVFYLKNRRRDVNSLAVFLFFR